VTDCLRTFAEKNINKRLIKGSSWFVAWSMLNNYYEGHVVNCDKLPLDDILKLE